MKNLLNSVKTFVLSHKRVSIVVLAIIVIAAYLLTRKTTTAAVTLQTATAEKGTLVSTISASGSITAGNSVQITTGASGTVNKIYVKAGQSVTQGQTIATLTLDQASQQSQAASYGSYLSAKNNLTSAQNNLYSLQAAEFAANQKLINDAVARNLATNDPTYIQENATWLKAEADYNNQSNIIKQAQTSVTSAWLTYQQSSATITSPAAGTIANLMIAEGLPITVSSSSTNTTSTQKVGTIETKAGMSYLSVNLSEIDVVKVSPGQKVTVSLDALSGKTFAGKVVVVDTSGQVTSGVTTYPATIAFESTGNTIYPSMAATARIITSVKDNVVLVPTSAISSANGQSTVRVMKNGQTTIVDVETGESNDTQTEIISGISEGDTVVTSALSTTGGSGTSQTQNSVFSGLGRGGGGFGGGGAVQVRRGG